MRNIVDTVGIKRTELEDKLRTVLGFYGFPCCPDAWKGCISPYFEWLGTLKCRTTGLDASLSFHLKSHKCSQKWSPNLLPV